MSNIIVLLLLIILNNQSLYGQHSSSKNDDELIREVYNISNSSSLQNINCQCVPIKDCPSYVQSTTETDDSVYGSGVIVPRIRECVSPYDVCCEITTYETVSPPPTEYNPPVEITSPSTPSSHKLPSCGFRNVKGALLRLKLRKSEAKFGEFPWMIAILEKINPYEGEDSYNKYHCGGSLLHPKVVLTAAHCVSSFVEKPELLVVRAGEWDASTTMEPYPYQDGFVEKIIIHEHYRSGIELNDAALIILKEDFVLADHINVVCLPHQDEDVDNINCIATGWGQLNIEDSNNIYNYTLKKVEVPIVPRDKCQEKLRETKLTSKFVLHESFLCAGGKKGEDTCKGDGGSPLICPVPEKKDYYYQVGVVAWGIGCGDTIPAVYVNIPHMRNWIDAQFSKNNLDSSYYQN